MSLYLSLSLSLSLPPSIPPSPPPLSLSLSFSLSLSLSLSWTSPYFVVPICMSWTTQSTQFCFGLSRHLLSGGTISRVNVVWLFVSNCVYMRYPGCSASLLVLACIASKVRMKCLSETIKEERAESDSVSVSAVYCIHSWLRLLGGGQLPRQRLFLQHNSLHFRTDGEKTASAVGRRRLTI